MNTIDFLVALGMAGAASLCLYLQWYPLALFAALFFLLIIVNVSIFHHCMPQPRWIIGIGVPKKDSEEEEEDSDE